MVFWLLILFTVLVWGMAPILDKMALENANPFQGVVIRSAAIMLVLIVAVLASGKFREIVNTDTRSMLYFSGSGILAGLIGVATYYGALRLGQTSQVVPLASTYPMVAVLLSILFLNEQVTLPRVIGTLFVVLGIYFLNLK